jgi:hypothetical protein
VNRALSVALARQVHADFAETAGPDRACDEHADASVARSFIAIRGTLGEVARSMRPLRLALLSLPLFVTTAAARPGGGNGGGGGGGALSKVSAGIGSASRGGASSSSDRPRTDGDVRRDPGSIALICYDGTGRVIDEHATDECYSPRVHHSGNTVLVKRRSRFYEPPRPPAVFSAYAGAQKVHDSDVSATIELAVTDRRLRVTGTYSRYFEKQTVGALTMQMPTLMGGVRIDDMGDTAVYLEGGVVHIRTDGDVMGDTKLSGPIAGMRVETPLSKQLTLIGDVQQMWFDHDIKATAGRVGVRYKYLQASFRVLDFNVGPPLMGPEVGVRF